MDELVLNVGADSRWVPVLVGPDDDVDAWAEEIATEVLLIRGHESPPRVVLEQATAVMAGIARNVQESVDAYPVIGAWSLMPGPQVYPETVAILRPVFPEGVTSRQRMVDELVAAPEDRYGDPVLEDLETPTGTATRIVQRLLMPGDEPGQQIVNETVSYVWWLAGAGTGLVLSTYFLDLVEGGRWRPDCDDLARLIDASIA